MYNLKVLLRAGLLTSLNWEEKSRPPNQPELLLLLIYSTPGSLPRLDLYKVIVQLVKPPKRSWYQSKFFRKEV